MTSPSIEDKVNAEVRQTAERIARNMRDLLSTTNRTNQRRWESQRAMDKMVSPHTGAADRLGKLAAGWTLAHRDRDNNPERAQKWDQLIKDNGIDPQQLYVTMTDREESLRVRAQAEQAAAQAQADRQQAQADRAAAEQERQQAQNTSPDPSMVSTIVPIMATSFALSELSQVSDTHLDPAVGEQLTLFHEQLTLFQAPAADNAATVSDQADMDQLLSQWHSTDLETALGQYQETTFDAPTPAPEAAQTREMPGLDAGL